MTYDAASKTATLTPSAALSYSTSYAATLTTGVKDSAGNALASNYTWSFTTTALLSAVEVCSNIDTATTWTSDKIYVVKCDISVNAPLTIQPGTIVKFKPGIYMSVNGSTLTANATQTNPIIFTSYKDDAHGGDTNGDGSATAPAAGDWDYIQMAGTGPTATFDYCEFYYGGGNSYDPGTILIGSNSATIKNSTFAHNTGGNLTNIYGAIRAKDAASGTVITGNTFYDNSIPLTVSGKFSIDDSNKFSNPADATQKNTYNGIFAHPGYGGNVTGNITWSETEVPYVIYTDSTIDAGSSLTLGDNVVVKFNGGLQLSIAGTLVNSSGTGVYFTSIKDDARGGDTNGDGSITTPADGNWVGILIDVVSPGTDYWATWSNIYYDSH